ncbi:MAG: histidine--tRNA ligase [Patescibacteria group bacterium UBA2103]
MKLDTDPYKGVRDFYPEDKALQQALFATIRGVLSRAGYQEYDASPLERAELYKTKTSEEIVNEQTYTFADRGDREVTLRPEMTPTLARMVARRRRELPLPIRWYSIGNRFRYERPQKGRGREFYQVDVDLLGAPEGEADLEIISMARNLLRAFSVGDEAYTIRINNRALLDRACEAAGVSDDDKKAYLHLLDRKAKMDKGEYEAQFENIFNGMADPLADLENNTNEEVQKEFKKTQEFIKNLKLRGVENAVYDPTLIRGFDYYTGFVFEFFDTDPENQKAFLGGGRYDNLLNLFSNDEMPAIGFALSDMRLIDFLEAHELLPDTLTTPDLYIATVQESNIEPAQKYAEELRNEGLSVIVNILDRKLDKQIKDAEKRGIQNLVVFGEDEAEGSLITLKNISTGEEVETKKENLIDLLYEEL